MQPESHSHVGRPGTQIFRVADIFPMSRAEFQRLGGNQANIAAVATGEKRPPRAGEYFLSGNPVEAYLAPNNLSTPYHIARLVQVETVTTIHIVKS